MATAGSTSWIYPSSSAVNGSLSSTTLGNLTADDGTFATITCSGDSSGYVNVEFTAPTIPTDAIVSHFEIEFEYRCTNTSAGGRVYAGAYDKNSNASNGYGAWIWGKTGYPNTNTIVNIQPWAHAFDTFNDAGDGAIIDLSTRAGLISHGRLNLAFWIDHPATCTLYFDYIRIKVHYVQPSANKEFVQTSWTQPGSIDEYDPLGVTPTWTDLANARVPDGSLATFDITKDTTTEADVPYLRLTNAGFSIPAGATIIGIEARHRGGHFDDTVYPDYLRPVVGWADGLQWESDVWHSSTQYQLNRNAVTGDGDPRSRPSSPNYGNTSFTAAKDTYHGSAGRLPSGLTIGPSDVNSSSFGVTLCAYSLSTLYHNDARSDGTVIRITYEQDAGVQYTRSAALSGAASLSVSASAARARSSALSASASLASAATRTRQRSVALAGAALQSAAAGATRPASAALAVAGSSLSVAGGVRTRQAALAAAASLAAVRAGLFRRAAPLAAAASLTAQTKRTRARTAALAASAALSAVQHVTRPRSAALAAAGTASVAATRTRARAAALAAAAAQAATAGATRPRAATMTGAAALAAAADRARHRSAAMGAAAGLAASAGATRRRSALLAVAGSSLGVAGATRAKTAALAAAATQTTNATKLGIGLASASLAAAGSIAAQQFTTRPRQVALSASGQVSAIAGGIRPRAAALAGAGAAAADAINLLPAVYRPSGSVANGWTTQAGGTDIHLAVDDPVRDDADYMRSPVLPAGEQARLQFSMQTPADPAVGIRWAAWSVGGVDVTVRLYEGATQRAAWTRSMQAGAQEYVEQLTPAEFAAIGDWSQVELRFEGLTT